MLSTKRPENYPTERTNKEYILYLTLDGSDVLNKLFIEMFESCDVSTLYTIHNVDYINNEPSKFPWWESRKISSFPALYECATHKVYYDTDIMAVLKRLVKSNIIDQLNPISNKAYRGNSLIPNASNDVDSKHAMFEVIKRLGVIQIHLLDQKYSSIIDGAKRTYILLTSRAERATIELDDKHLNSTAVSGNLSTLFFDVTRADKPAITLMSEEGKMDEPKKISFTH